MPHFCWQSALLDKVGQSVNTCFSIINIKHDLCKPSKFFLRIFHDMAIVGRVDNSQPLTMVTIGKSSKKLNSLLSIYIFLHRDHIHFSFKFFHRIKLVAIRCSFSGNPNFSLPNAILLIKNAIFLPSVRIVCSPSSSFQTSSGVYP